jgi:predicted MFS family arabinose efflux permease
MLGLFLLLPVFSIHAKDLPGGDQAFLIGLALGIFNIVQACFHIPLGRLSDRIGRKTVVLWGLSLFVAGALICATKDDLLWISIGRGVMGAGAISAAVSAWVADLTREQVRSQAMALVGASISLSFAVSLVVAAPLYRMISLSGMFLVLAILGAVAMVVTYFVLPNNKPEVQLQQDSIKVVFLRPELMRLNIGVFVLNATQVAMFLVVPLLLEEAGFPLSAHWQVYLSVVLLSFVFMVPLLIYGEKKQRIRLILLIAIVLLIVAEIIFTQATSVMLIAVALLIYFVGFNLLEALQPSLVTRYAKESKGTALGVYNTTQSIGLFSGAVIGGWLMDSHGNLSVFFMGGVLLLCWLIIAWSMRELPARAVASTDSTAKALL